jgi:hypothetical protein
MAFLVVALLAPTTLIAALWARARKPRELRPQVVLVDGVHDVFPQPVPYIDRCAMIGSFPKVGPFMSTWAMSDYRHRGEPVMRRLLREEQPQFLLQNVGALRTDKTFGRAGARGHRLLREDFELLQESFIPHWGPLWVAGKVVALEAGGPDVETEVFIPGPYVVEAGFPVQVDGAWHEPGDVVDLDVGVHKVRSDGASAVAFRTANAGPAPRRRPPRQASIFTGFDLDP